MWTPDSRQSLSQRAALTPTLSCSPTTEPNRALARIQSRQSCSQKSFGARATVSSSSTPPAQRTFIVQRDAFIDFALNVATGLLGTALWEAGALVVRKALSRGRRSQVNVLPLASDAKPTPDTRSRDVPAPRTALRADEGGEPLHTRAQGGLTKHTSAMINRLTMEGLAMLGQSAVTRGVEHPVAEYRGRQALRKLRSALDWAGTPNLRRLHTRLWMTLERGSGGLSDARCPMMARSTGSTVRCNSHTHVSDSASAGPLTRSARCAVTTSRIARTSPDGAMACRAARWISVGAGSACLGTTANTWRPRPTPLQPCRSLTGWISRRSASSASRRCLTPESSESRCPSGTWLRHLGPTFGRART